MKRKTSPFQREQIYTTEWRMAEKLKLKSVGQFLLEVESKNTLN